MKRAEDTDRHDRIGTSAERRAVASDPSRSGRGANVPRGRHVSGMQEAPFLGSAWQGVL